MHAGYAIYFPELFPDRLRATGTGLCFNGGRFIAAPLLFLSGSIKSSMDLRLAITMLAGPSRSRRPSAAPDRASQSPTSATSWSATAPERCSS